MDSSERASHNSPADMKVTETAVIAQVMTFKAFSVQRFIQMMQTVVQRSCKAFCIPLQEKPAGCPVHTPQTTRKSPKVTELLQHSPPTMLIVNITNSTLTDCVIGDTYPCAAPDLDSLLQESPLQRPDQPRCSCCHDPHEAAHAVPPAPPPPQAQHLNISIQRSQLRYVIIGDNNRMHIELGEVD